MVIHADTNFLQMFIWEHFSDLAPNFVESLILGMMEAINEVSWQKPSSLYRHHPWRWSNVKHTNNKSLRRVIDEEKNFDFCPGTYTPWIISKVKLFEVHIKVSLVLCIKGP